jgi:parallel beta-helix repeat protein
VKLRSIIGLLMLAAATWASGQTTIYVAPGGDDARDGRGSWANAVKTISNGVALANAGDLVLVSNGTYDTVATIQINKAITLRGLDRGTTIIKGNYPSTTHQGIRIADSGATVAHITVTACGFTDVEGGGIWVNRGVLNDCMVTGNMAKSGGGVYVRDNGLLTECQILNNSSSTDDGGGVCVRSSNSGVVLSNCLIAANEVDPVYRRYGGGVALKGGAPVLVGCVISNNTASSIGGGIYIGGAGSPVMRDCRIVENTGGGRGGGVVLADNCTALFTNCLVADNIVTNGSGGGINSGSYGSGALTMLWCRVTGNKASQTGAGISMSDGLLDHCVITDNLLTNNGSPCGAGIYIRANATAELRNCLIAGNTSGQGSGGSMGIDQNTTATVVNCTIVSNYSHRDCGGVYFYSANGDADRFYNCVIASNTVGVMPSVRTKNLYLRTAAQSNAFYYSCGDLLTNTAQGNITNDPCLVNLAAGDYRLAQGSPCINTGTNLPWLAEAVDLDGRTRIDRFSGLVDMGCYEHVPQGIIFNLR